MFSTLGLKKILRKKFREKIFRKKNSHKKFGKKILKKKFRKKFSGKKILVTSPKKREKTLPPPGAEVMSSFLVSSNFKNLTQFPPFTTAV